MKQRLQLVARTMLGRDPNPLLRQVDRIEAAIMVGLVVAFLAAAPLVSIYAGRLADAQGLREQRTEQSWRQEQRDFAAERERWPDRAGRCVGCLVGEGDLGEPGWRESHRADRDAPERAQR